MKKAACIFFFITLAAGAAGAQDAAELISGAEAALGAGRYDQAARLVQQARDADGALLNEAVRKGLGQKPFDTGALEKSLADLAARSRKLSRQAQDFDQQRVLDSLGTNALNGFVYRLDDHFNEAIVSGGAAARTAQESSPAGFAVNFDETDSVRMIPSRSQAAVENGILKYRHAKYGYLESDGALDIDRDLIGDIVLRIKCRNAKRVQLAWSREPDAFKGSPANGEVEIDTVPDDRFHTYRINAANALRWHMDFGDRIRKIFFYPSAIAGDDLEIDYIRFVSKAEKYREAPAGVSYETIAQTMRRVIYANTPLTITYDVMLPEQPCTLSLGTGILNPGAPVGLSVKVVPQAEPGRTASAQAKEIYAVTMQDTQSWTDAKLDMSAWSGSRIRLQCELSGPGKNIAFISNPVLYSPPRKKMNIIIVLEDALRADHMSCYGSGRTTTPVKDEWIRGGVQFLYAFSQETKTRPSCPSIMTSLYPTATGVWHFTDMLDERYLTLAEILRSQGFETASFIQNDNAGPLAGLHQGFSYLIDSGTLGSRAESLYADRLFEWMDAHRDRNFFLYLHVLDPHGVYDPPAPFDAFYREAPRGGRPVKKDALCFDPDWIEQPTIESRNQLYDGEVRCNDHCFTLLLDKLSAGNLAHDTAVIVIGDHGEHLGEHGLWEHRPPGYVQVLRVPLLMAYPAGLPKGLKISRPVQLIDVMPTILELASIDASRCIMQGDSLLPLIGQKNPSYWDGRAVFSEEVSFKKKNATGEWCSVFFRNRHVLNSGSLSDEMTRQVQDKKLYTAFFTTRMFDYVSDPQETAPADWDLADIVYFQNIKSLVREIQANNMKFHETLTGGTQRDIRYDPEAVQRLKGLGYIQ